MKVSDHDYDGKERWKHRMDMVTQFDGELIWLQMKGVHSWTDGCYVHEWTHAFTLETFQDIIHACTAAVNKYIYITEVVPQMKEEIDLDAYDQCIFSSSEA